MGGCLIVLFSKWGRWEGDWPLFLSTSRTWEQPRHAHRRHLKSKFCGGGKYCVYQWAEPPRPYWAVYGDNANIVEWWLTPCGRKVWSLNQAAVPPLRQFSGDFHAKCVFVVRQTPIQQRSSAWNQFLSSIVSIRMIHHHAAIIIHEVKVVQPCSILICRRKAVACING